MLGKPNTHKISGFKLNTIALAITAVLPVGMSYAEEIKELPTAQARSKR